MRCVLYLYRASSGKFSPVTISSHDSVHSVCHAERTAEDNATLLKQVSFLDKRVTVLSEQLKQFGNLYKQNRS